MEDPRRASRVSALLWFFLLCFCCKHAVVVDASHVVYRTLQSMEPPSVGTKHRTGYHFQPRKNWINDPNGPMYYKGYYHLFYQYNPKGAVWGNIVWAHSVSKDLINWTPLPPAIYPTDTFDVNGCWSGSATILPDGKPVIFYTGINPDHHQVQNVAVPSNLSDPFLVEWSKPAYNPLIVSPPGINVTFFRDPTTAWLGPDRHWRVVVGSKRKLRGMAFLYRSRDFRTWVQAHHPLHSSAGTGMWECPDFYPVSVAGEEGVDTSAGLGAGYRHVLKVSLDLTRYEYYTIGTYDMSRDRYVPDSYLNDDRTGLRYDYGNYYASKTFFDENKRRRILWGWSNESDSVISDNNKGWAGIQTIPRKIWLEQSGRQLLQWPVEELEQLRGDEVKLAGLQLKSGGGIYRVDGFQTSEADVEVTFLVNDLEKAEPFDPSWTADPQRLCGMKGADVKGGVGPFGLLVLATGDRSEQTAVLFRVFKGQGKHVVLTCHDPSRSTSMSDVYKPSYGGFVDVDISMDKKLSMRVLVDNSVVESFAAGGKTCITSRVYPVLAEGQSSNLFAFNNGESDVVVSELRAWKMKRPLNMN